LTYCKAEALPYIPLCSIDASRSAPNAKHVPSATKQTIYIFFRKIKDAEDKVCPPLVYTRFALRRYNLKGRSKSSLS